MQSDSSWEAGGLSYQQLSRPVFNKASLPPAPTYQADSCLSWTKHGARFLRMGEIAACSSSTSPSLTDGRQHRTSAEHVKAVSTVVCPPLAWLEHNTEQNNAWKYALKKHHRNTLWECHMCVLVYVTLQVSKSVMAVVSEGYCLTKTLIEGFSGYSWECGEVNQWNTVWVPGPGWLPVLTYTVQRAIQQVIRKGRRTFSHILFNLFQVSGLECFEFWYIWWLNDKQVWKVYCIDVIAAKIRKE